MNNQKNKWLYFNRLFNIMKSNRPVFATIILLSSLLVAGLDAVTPPEVPTDALYTFPIWLGLAGFGWWGGVGVSSGAIVLFYVSNYRISHDTAQNLWPAILITYGLFLLFSWGANLFLLNQRQLEQTRQNLNQRVVELDQLYQESQQLHQQSLRLAVTEERNRMAREIHDVLAQGLAAIIFQVEAAQLDFANQSGLEKRLQQISQLAHHNLQEARLSVANLRPISLVDISLEQALARKIAELSAEPGLKATFTTNNEGQALTTEVERALFRITQEALTNVSRHAKASEVRVTLDWDAEEEEICLTIQDNGQGFDMAEEDADRLNELSANMVIIQGTGLASKKFGLSSMQERASLIGGWATIQSQLGQGCRVRVIVPYARALAGVTQSQSQINTRLRSSLISEEI